MLRSNDAAISALAEFLDELVLRVDNKIRVQSIKTDSLHANDTAAVLVDERQGDTAKILLIALYRWRDEGTKQGMGDSMYEVLQRWSIFKEPRSLG